jgi:hypothetical protein
MASTEQTDLKRLAAEVSAQHGIRIDADDPAMAVVTMNRIVFERSVAQVLERMDAATRSFDEATERLQTRVGGLVAREVRECTQALRKDLNGIGGRVGSRWDLLSVVVGMALACGIFALGVMAGRIVR